MKKVLLSLLFPLLLSSCGGHYDDYTKWRIITPTGAPAIAMSYFSGYENFETNSDPVNIVAMMKAGKADAVVLPTNVGMQAIRQGNLPFKIFKTLTHGNIYIASTGNDDDGLMDSDDYIVSFQKGAVPDKIFHYVYGDEYENALHYVSNAQEAAKCLKLGKNLADDKKDVDYVVLAEPALTTVLETTPNAKQYADLQELYKVKSGGKEIFQAALFVSNELDMHTLMEPFQSYLHISINDMKKTPETAETYMNLNSNPELTFGVKPEVARKMFENGNRMNIDCKDVWKERESINLFLSIFGVDPLNENEVI